MNLRPRLVMTTLAVAVPTLFAFGLAFQQSKQDTDDEFVKTLVLTRFSLAELGACEASPPVTPIGISLPTLKPDLLHPVGHSGKVSVFTYDRSGRSTQPGAPTIPPAVLDEVQKGAVREGSPVVVAVGNERQLVIPLPNGRGLCSLALVTTPRRRPPLPPPHEVIVPIAFALLSGLIGIWPVVRRIRSTTLAVRRWEQGGPLLLRRDARPDELGVLERVLTDSAETIRRQHEALVARQKALLDFIENTTHDLATPLTVLQGILSAIAKDQPAEAVHQAMKEAQYIGALLSNLAVSAKFEVAAHVETSLDLRDVVSRVVDRHRAMAGWMGVTLERSVPEEQVLVRGDPTFTERSLANLVENAMRHNARGGHVAVVLEAEGSGFVLCVLDDGPGLTQEECERALQWGKQGDAARSRAPGGGLGLSICSRVAQLQGWRFALAPREGGGLLAELRGQRC